MDRDGRNADALRMRWLAVMMAAVMIGACGGGSSDGNAPSPSPSPSPSPAPFPTVDPSNLCENLVSDQNPHPMTAVAKPALLGSYTDPNFLTTIRRITDAKAQFNADYAKPVYSTMPAWNADESYLILYVPEQGHKLFNGKTYAYIRDLNIDTSDIEHVYWSATDADALYYPSGNALKVYHPSSDTSETLKTFSAAWVSFGGDPIYGDWSSNLFGFQSAAGPLLWWRTSGAMVNGPSGTGAPQISSSGAYYVFGQNLYNATTNALVRAMTINATEHGATGRLANGDDVWVSTQFDLPDGQNGNLIVENLSTGAVTTLIGEANGWDYPRVGTHVSAHAVKNPGWVAVSMTGTTEGTYYLDREIALANVNSGVVCRVAHHRSYGQEGNIGYWAEPHVNISPTGTRMIFASDWNNGSTVDTYVVELPSYRP